MASMGKGAVAGVAGAVGAVAAAGVVAGRRLVRGAARVPSLAPGDADVVRWHAVTVYKDRSEVEGGPLPEPLAGLGDAVEIRFADAPGGKGTEVHVRQRGDGGPVAERTRQIRLALRRSKQLLETGEMLRPDPSSTTPTPLNAPLRKATAHALEEGRL